MLGYRDSGMADTPPNEHPDSFHQADLDEAAGRLVAVIRRDTAAGRHHLQRRPARLPAPRPPQGPRHLAAGVRPGRRPGLVPRARRAVPAVEAVLLGVVAGPDADDPRDAARAATASHRSTRSGSSARTPTTASPPRSRSATSSSPARSRCGPTPPRSTRPSRGGSGSTTPSSAEVYPWEDWILARSLVGPDPHRRLRARPVRRRALVRRQRAVDRRRRVQYRVIVGKKDEIVDGPDDADLVVSVPLVEVQAAGFDPAVAYMQGKLKSTGPTGPLFELLRSGEAASELTPARCTSLSSL